MADDLPPASGPAGGAAVDGPAAGGAAVDGPAVDGPAVDGPAVDGPAVDGPAPGGPPGPRPSAAVIVGTHDRASFLADALSSVVASLGPSDSLVVVGTGPVPVDLPGRHLTSPPGKSRQLNAGVASASAAWGASAPDVIVITDDDCRVAPGWVAALTSVFADPRVGVAFGPVEGLDHVPGEGPTRLPPGPAPLEYWIYAHGASMAVRRSALLEVGGFDDRLGPGAPAHGEEGDLVLRLREAGWECRIADAPPVAHLDWRSPAETAANLLVYERGSGALLGAALRRSFRTSAKVFVLRLKYQAQLWSAPRSRGWAFGPRTLAAFLGGVVVGLRMEPRR